MILVLSVPSSAVFVFVYCVDKLFVVVSWAMAPQLGDAPR